MRGKSGLASYDICIIGGGIIGLATAMRVTQEYPRLRVAVLEKEREVALHQTGHNSGVIHAGIYYAPGSSKANFCAAGGQMLRRFCDARGIQYKMCGKVIVAIDESELPMLHELHRRGVANGAQGLEVVDQTRLRELEPHAAGVKAVHSPQTGIIDYTDVARAFVAETREKGGDLLTNTEVWSIVERSGVANIETSNGNLSARQVINCAGLQADTIAKGMGLDPGVRIIPFRGEYFSLRPERSGLVNGLIYPVPNPRLPFLGVHFTKRVTGTVEAGPNAVLAFAREGYRKFNFNPSELAGVLAYPGFWRMSRTHWRSGVQEQVRSVARRLFARSLRRLVPEVTVRDLHDPSAGVRAQAVGRNGELLQDFSIVRSRSSIHVLNAPSPGATASMAIGRHIVDLARETFDLAA